jgi:hypothetical protein
MKNSPGLWMGKPPRFRIPWHSFVGYINSAVHSTTRHADSVTKTVLGIFPITFLNFITHLSPQEAYTVLKHGWENPIKLYDCSQ